MKKLTLATLSTLALTLPCTNVFAVDGTLTVNGVVTDQTCTLQASGSDYATGLKDITVDMGAWPKSWFTPTNQSSWEFIINLYIKNADGTANCDAATIGALKGIHLSAISPASDLDATDKTLLVNKASGASSTNPIFIRFKTMAYEPVDFSAPWGDQVKSGKVFTVGDAMYLEYYVAFVSKTGVVDAQNVQAKINYTMHYN
jgi:major type 1 subunit fimbrin (pilin)